MTREQARREIDSLDFYLQNHSDDYGEESHMAMMMAIEALSSSENPKMGQWKRISRDMYVQHAMAYYECSECGKKMIGTHNYCPNCGAKMQEAKE